MRKLYETIRALKQWPGRGRPGDEEDRREILFPPIPISCDGSTLTDDAPDPHIAQKLRP